MADLQNDLSCVLLNDWFSVNLFIMQNLHAKGFSFVWISWVTLEALFRFGFIMYQHVISSFLEKRTFCLSMKVWPVKHHYHHPTSYWNHVLGKVCPSNIEQSSTTTTTPPRIGIMYWVRSVHRTFSSQAPLPPPHLVLELCIGLGLSVKVWPVKHHYHHPTSYWNYVLG